MDSCTVTGYSLFVKWKAFREPKKLLKTYYEDYSPSIGTIHMWITDFRCGP